MTPSSYKRFKQWMERNSQDPAQLSKIDVDSEFDLDLTYNEAVELALRKFPTFFRQDLSVGYGDKPKQIVFVKELIERIISGRVQVTYRKAPKVGSYYVIDNRFKQKPESSRILIEFYQTDKVDPYKLTDEEAQLAGVESAQKIRELFERWYGSPIPALYRNWFRVKEAA